MYLSGILFYVAPIASRAAVAKLGNGARFRVSSRRGSQVQILAAASPVQVNVTTFAHLPREERSPPATYLYLEV
jgi:hypothetical protein